MEGFGPLIIEESDESSESFLSIEDQLAKFREQWQSELRSNKSGQNLDLNICQPTEEEEAKYLFLQGIEAERSHCLPEAIKYYRKAVQLVPDIEFRITEDDISRADNKRNRLDSESSILSDGLSEEIENIEDVLERLFILQAQEGIVCQMELSTNRTHFSNLPPEIIAHIIKWVVGKHLDVESLENLGMVCRGLFVSSRDEKIWRGICQQIWGINCSSVKKYGCWRNMYIHRPHLRYNGVYISKMSYLRQGEVSLDGLYNPFHIVEYYRYVRFYSDGRVVHLTSPEHPRSVVGVLKWNCRLQGLQYGYYKMAGDNVTVILKRRIAEKSTYQRYKSRRNKNGEALVEKQKFQAEFTVRNVGKRAGAQLVWNRYAVLALNQLDNEEDLMEFELKPATYPPLIFSQVRSYTAYAEEPLF
ncbi:DgyrCDS4115 [Dimorphilus gyrociliatus]|uniref:DgyrCDS4115 n=1 Tax=Dimorphilus gyrociliatus TaxID=2664684 RepID=A0A7I8VFN7_9ANNE|nr:DgyrCDS4115 [Dimorphilus gyrociliatus]